MTLMVLWQELYPLSCLPLSRSHSSLSFTADNKILVKIRIFNSTQNPFSCLRHPMPNVLRLFIILFHDLKLGFIWWLYVDLRNVHRQLQSVAFLGNRTLSEIWWSFSKTRQNQPTKQPTKNTLKILNSFEFFWIFNYANVNC